MLYDELERAREREDLAFRLGLWKSCPHTMKYGDDGEMQCAGSDFKRGGTDELILHVARTIMEQYEMSVVHNCPCGGQCHHDSLPCGMVCLMGKEVVRA